MQQLKRHPHPGHLPVDLVPVRLREHALMLTPAREQPGIHLAVRTVGDLIPNHTGRVGSLQHRRDALPRHSLRCWQIASVGTPGLGSWYQGSGNLVPAPSLVCSGPAPCPGGVYSQWSGCALGLVVAELSHVHVAEVELARQRHLPKSRRKNRSHPNGSTAQRRPPHTEKGETPRGPAVMVESSYETYLGDYYRCAAGIDRLCSDHYDCARCHQIGTCLVAVCHGA